jgi:predicted short-subunit dehydrogenase-like oxidoreductase (DUF2520 family)
VTLTILGAGALARALVEALPPRRGLRVRVAARRPAAARALARLRPGTLAAPGYVPALAEADVVLLAVDDRAIRRLAADIAPLRRSWRGVVVLHAAGALGREVLAPLARRGAATGILHPIVPLSRAGGTPLSGAHARLAGAPRALAAARRLAAAAGLVPLPRTRPERSRDRDLHHAAASLATNDVVALAALAEGALVASGVRRSSARRAVAAAAAATLARIVAAGPEGALSGPVPRGDPGRVLGHLSALRSVHPAAAPAHAALTLRLVDLALAAGRLDARAARAFSRALRGPGTTRTV